MFRRLPVLALLLLTICSVGLFATGGHFAASFLIEAQRARQLDDLVQLALRRSETAVDYGADALDDLALMGPLACDAVSLQAVRFHVYQRGPVKDIRIVNRDGGVRCSAYSETLEFDRSWVSRDEMLPSADATLRLFRVDQFFGIALGVLKDIDADNSLIAILGFSTALLDVMPVELRDHSEVAVELADGRPIANMRTGEQTPALAGRVLTVTASSARYPLNSVIRVEAEAVAAWNREAYTPIIVLAVALGFAFGLLLARALSRPESPVADLDRAIAAREFKPYLQPTFDLATGAITGCEILARWVKADGSVLAPARFINLAEESGRIAAMTWQLLSQALADLRAELRRDKLFKLSVNIAPSHFIAPGFVNDLRRVVSAARVAHRQIVVELTEREVYEDLEKAAAVVAELRSYGFRVAIDDVGIGNSGLSQLQRLGADILKIDKFFVDAINRDATARSIVEMLVRLADKLNMSSVAEGVEDAVQVEALRQCGVSIGQGYYLSPPVPPAAFLELLETVRHDNAPAKTQVSAA
ncbi:MAG: EAL domain-containing protein [Cucumibacter sp.]